MFGLVLMGLDCRAQTQLKRKHQTSRRRFSGTSFEAKKKCQEESEIKISLHLLREKRIIFLRAASTENNNQSCTFESTKGNIFIDTYVHEINRIMFFIRNVL